MNALNGVYPPGMRRRTNVPFRSHIGWDVAGHAEMASKHHN